MGLEGVRRGLRLRLIFRRLRSQARRAVATSTTHEHERSEHHRLAFCKFSCFAASASSSRKRRPIWLAPMPPTSPRPINGRVAGPRCAMTNPRSTSAHSDAEGRHGRESTKQHTNQPHRGRHQARRAELTRDRPRIANMLRARIADEPSRQRPRLDVVLEGDDTRNDSVIVSNYVLCPNLRACRQLVGNVWTDAAKKRPNELGELNCERADNCGC